MSQIAFIFPGQGSQYVGMGQDLYDTDPRARELFDLAEATTGLPLKRLCFSRPHGGTHRNGESPAGRHPGQSLPLPALQEAGVTPQAVCGHSLGEYSALFAAGVLSAADTLAAVRNGAVSCSGRPRNIPAPWWRSSA